MSREISGFRGIFWFLGYFFLQLGIRFCWSAEKPSAPRWFRIEAGRRGLLGSR
ncbi:MAG: hypothetical protein LBG87_04195 [Spirochaetaceae bacterium]|nr:hypothetical protein [Spirochaetaceae bacterium]